MPAKRRYNIEKKVRAHNRKVKKEAKKQNKGKKKKPIINVPNACPFKDEILNEVNELKRKKEEERQKQRAQWKLEREEVKKLEKEAAAAGGLEKLVATAETKEKVHNAFEIPEDKPFFTKKDGSVKAFYKEFKKVVEAADVVLEVVDARDPLGTRCKQVEQAVLESSGNKRLVIVVNKADLVPRKVLDDWLKYLRGSFPTVPFKASTQMQTRKLGRKKLGKGPKGGDSLQVSSCVGAELLMSLLANYCRNKGVKTAIRVGVVGLPNVGKSSIINSLKRSRACNVGATPGVTRTMQEVQLDTKVKLLDSPGLVFASSSSNSNNGIIALKNAAKVESIADPFLPASAILQRTTKHQLMELYDIGEFNSPEEFFTLKAKRQGKFKKGGAVDPEAAARGLIEDWNKGKIHYYTLPPEAQETHVSSEIVKEMAKEFDLANFETMEVEALSELAEPKGLTFKVDRTDMTESMEMDNTGISPNVVVQQNEVKTLKRKLPISEVNESSDLIPVSNKKLQKKMAKKIRKESTRRAKETTSLAGVLENFSLDDMN
ncbi:hypothetical protein AAG570_009500 [Ranatra chinensis]|uniref:Guanine nucleotide-binding protein-like 3 homolog n=1 Tax=Ranatra chinensis TaxID=642074 RepID=A0ABD0ZCJ2_9HEMI